LRDACRASRTHPAGASERVEGVEIARVGSASAALIDLLDERRTQGRPRRWAPARAHCQIEVRSNKMGRATHRTASSLELIPDKDIAQSRSRRRRVAKDSDEGVLPADASAPAHEFIMNECPGIGTTAQVSTFFRQVVLLSPSAARTAACSGVFGNVENQLAAQEFAGRSAAPHCRLPFVFRLYRHATHDTAGVRPAALRLAGFPDYR
jgi:hypothetical protein